jgi:transcriptional regulator
VYVPQAFEETRVEKLHACIRAHPLAALVSMGPDGLDANHIPFLVDAGPGPCGTLRGHLARANPAWRALAESPAALAIFQGPQAYVSPSWYPGKREHGMVVPTWNYVVVHAYGRVRIIEDAQWLRALVTRLTDEHESARSQPWKVTDAPEEFVARQLRAIVGVEIPVEKLVGKWKASQNRSREDVEAVTAGLTEDRSVFVDVMPKS